MKLSQIQDYEGECCPVQLIKGEIKDQFLCTICYQLMTTPVSLSCSAKHTFGMFCLKLWSKNKQQILCPYCRFKTSSWCQDKTLKKQLNTLLIMCPYCTQWEGNLDLFNEHRNTCKNKMKYLKQQLSVVINSQMKQLDKQINPHLKEKHGQIYEKYVKNWEWLQNDDRDWKWWWWCNNPWWGNISCPECNKLWHRYQTKIDLQESKRIKILKLISIMQKSDKQPSKKQQHKQLNN